MKLSNKTINYLKHFATISPNFLFRQGNKQSAISPIKDRVAMATFDTSFPANFPLGNLGGFLKVVSSFENPDLKFTKTRITISDESGSIYFKPAKLEDLIVQEKEIKFPNADFEFDITRDQISSIIKSLKNHSFYTIYFNGNGKNISAVTESAYRGDYVYEQLLGKTNKKFSFRFLSRNLFCPIDDYKVSIGTKGIAMFQSKTSDYISYVAPFITNP